MGLAGIPPGPVDGGGVGSTGLARGSANSVWKGLESQYLSSVAAWPLLCPLCHKTHSRRRVNKWAWACHDEIVFMDTEFEFCVVSACPLPPI